MAVSGVPGEIEVNVRGNSDAHHAPMNSRSGGSREQAVRGQKPGVGEQYLFRRPTMKAATPEANRAEVTVRFAMAAASR